MAIIGNSADRAHYRRNNSRLEMAMTMLLPTLAVAFAAFCVWLAVRIVNRRETWAKWTLAIAILIAPPAGYVSA